MNVKVHLICRDANLWLFTTCFLFLTIFDQENTFVLTPVTVVLERLKQHHCGFKTRLVLRGKTLSQQQKQNAFVLYFVPFSCGVLPLILESSGPSVAWVEDL